MHSADGILDRFFRARPVIPGVSVLGVGPAVSPLAVGDEEGQGGDSVEFFVGVGLGLCGVHGSTLPRSGLTLHSVELHVARNAEFLGEAAA